MRYTSPLLGFNVGVEVAKAVKEKALTTVDYAVVKSFITSGSPVVAGQKESAPIAVYRRLGQTTHELLWSVELFRYRFHISFICGYLIVASSNGAVTATLWVPSSRHTN